MKPLPLTFAPFDSHSCLIHGFSLRDDRFPLSAGPESILPSLGIDINKTVQAEQTHGSQVALVDQNHQATTLKGVDALMTARPGIFLVIRTADCAPVYLWDPNNRAVALIHSGKKGTLSNISENTVKSLKRNFGSRPGELIAVIGPCIRPPDYEMDIATNIRVQLENCGVNNCYDCGENTASDLSRFYSYRTEKGKTGRHYAFLSLNA